MIKSPFLSLSLLPPSPPPLLPLSLGVIDWRSLKAGTPIVFPAAHAPRDWSAFRGRRHQKRLLS